MCLSSAFADGNISKFGATVDTDEIKNYSTPEKIELMSKITQDKKSITNPNVRFVQRKHRLNRPSKINVRSSRK